MKWEHDTRSASGAYSAAGGAGAAPTLTTSADASSDASTPAATTTATDGVSVTHKRTTTYTIPATRAKDYGKIGVKVGISVNGADGTSATATSAKVDLAAVPSGVTGLKAAINVTETSGSSAPNAHTITASWSGPGSPALEHRIALEVQVPATTGTWEWVVFDGSPHAQPGITRNTTPGKTDFGQWKMGGYNLSSGDGRWPDDDSGDTYQLSVEQLRNVRALRVDTRVDGGEWMKHAATSSIDRTSKPYKPSSDASLGSLTLSQGTLTPAFSSTVGTYTANVGNDVASITMGLGTPTGATIEVTRITADGRLSLTGANGVYVVDLVVGSNEIEIKLTSEDRSATKTYTVTVTRAAATTVRLGAPRNLRMRSAASAQLTVGWVGPATIEASLQAVGYQIREDGTEDWTDVAAATEYNVHQPTATPPRTVTNGAEYKYWVRAKATDPNVTDDPATTTVDESDVFGEAVSVSGRPWPTVSGAWTPSSTIAEKDDPDTDGDQHVATLTISAVDAGGTATAVFHPFMVEVSVVGENNADAVTFDKQIVTIPAGNTPTATIEVTAEDDVVAAADKTIVVDMKLLPSEAADRESVRTPDLTISSDPDDEVPGAPTAVAVSAPTQQTATTSTHTVTWTLPADWGSGAEDTRQLEYRSLRGDCY